MSYFADRPPTPAYWPVASFNPAAHTHFMHLPKCAGTSVQLIAQNAFDLGSIITPDDQMQYCPPAKFEFLARKLPHSKFSCGHIGSGIFALFTPPSNVFTWLRDPVDAAISISLFIRQQFLLKIKDPHYPDDSYNGWVAKTVSNLGLHEALLQILQSGRHNESTSFEVSRPLSNLLTKIPKNRSTDSISTAIKTLHECFLIGLVEEQKKSLEMLSRFLPIRCPAGTFHVHKTRDRPENFAPLTASQREVIRDLLAAEYEIYNEGVQLWRELYAALEKEGWFRVEPLECAYAAITRLHNSCTTSGCWRADQAVFAEGLHDIDFLPGQATEEKRVWQWTAPGRRAAIRLPIPPCQNSRVALTISEVTPLPQIHSLRISADGKAVGLRYREKNQQGYSFEFILHAHEARGFGVDIELIAENILRPGGIETRELGVALNEISWEPF